jgi:hypothetical protein
MCLLRPLGILGRRGKSMDEGECRTYVSRLCLTCDGREAPVDVTPHGRSDGIRCATQPLCQVTGAWARSTLKEKSLTQTF